MNIVGEEDQPQKISGWQQQDEAETYAQIYVKGMLHKVNRSPERKLEPKTVKLPWRKHNRRNTRDGSPITTSYMNQNSLKTDKEYLLQYLSQEQTSSCKLSPQHSITQHRPAHKHDIESKYEDIGKVDMSVHKKKTVISQNNESLSSSKVMPQQSQRMNIFTGLKSAKKRRRIFVKSRYTQELVVKPTPIMWGKTMACNGILLTQQKKQEQTQNKKQRSKNVKKDVRHQRWMTLNAIKKPIKFPLFYRQTEQQIPKLSRLRNRKNKSEFSSVPCESQANPVQFTDDNLFKTKLIRG